MEKDLHLAHFMSLKHEYPETKQHKTKPARRLLHQPQLQLLLKITGN